MFVICGLFLGANSPVQGDDGGDFNIGNCCIATVMAQLPSGKQT